MVNRAKGVFDMRLFSRLGVYILAVFLFGAVFIIYSLPVQAVELDELPLNAADTFKDENPEGAYQIFKTADKGYIIASYTISIQDGKKDIYIRKTNSDGDTVWERTFGGDRDDEANYITECKRGGYIVCGYTKSAKAKAKDVYMLKLSKNGAMEWERRYGGDYDDEASYVMQCSDGGYLLIGYSCSFGVKSSDLYVIKTDVKGKKVWEECYGRNEADAGRSALELGKNGYLIMGSSRSFGNGSLDIYLIRINPSGRIVWESALGGDKDYVAYSLQRLYDRSYLVTGFVYSSAERNTCMLVIDNFGKLRSESILSENFLCADPLYPPVAPGSARDVNTMPCPSMPSAKGTRN